MVLEIIICKFSWILKLMSRDTFPEPHSDSASYWSTWKQSPICKLYYRWKSIKRHGVFLFDRNLPEQVIDN